MLNAGANVNHQNDFGKFQRNAKFIRNGRIEIKFNSYGYKRIIKTQKHTLQTGKTALHRAIEYDQDKIVDELIRKGADVNLVDYFGRTPLYIASRNGNEKIVQSLGTHCILFYMLDIQLIQFRSV